MQDWNKKVTKLGIMRLCFKLANFVNIPISFAFTFTE